MVSSNDQYLSLAQVAKLAPGRPSAGAVWRWLRHGVRCRDGQVVRLKHGRAGKRVFTTREWLDEFFQQVAQTDLHRWEAREKTPTAPRPLATARRAEREHLAASRRLAKAGL